MTPFLKFPKISTLAKRDSFVLTFWGISTGDVIYSTVQAGLAITDSTNFEKTKNKKYGSSCQEILHRITSLTKKLELRNVRKMTN